MNDRLPTGEYSAHFWAEPSRALIRAIQISTGLQRVLKNSTYAFTFDSYYQSVIEESQRFLSGSGGSELPPHMKKIDLYYTLPIFLPQNSINIGFGSEKLTYAELKLIGEGSYAQVFKYKDAFYNKRFAIKRAKKDLNAKELERFKREFEQISALNSPYIIDVYRYDDINNEYIMELMDCSLDKYIEKHNTAMDIGERKNIINQILRVFQYIHSKDLLHRDISPKNILLRLYEDVIVVKISDFGLVKIPDSQLTTVNADFKGYFNDPSLIVDGFDKYSMVHETYALTRLIYYVMTGKTNLSDINGSNMCAFVTKGLSADKKIVFNQVLN